MRFVMEEKAKPESRVTLKETAIGIQVRVGDYHVLEFRHGEREIRMSSGVSGGKIGLDTDSNGCVKTYKGAYGGM